MMADSSHKDPAAVARLAALFATSIPTLGIASMAEPGLQASSRDAISGVISGAVSVSSTLVAEASLADQIWYELNRPPVTLNPFEVSPVGYVFVAMYASYLGWQIFRPASEAEIEIEAKRQAAAEEAARSSVGFLQEAAAEENAKVLPSGLVYTQLSEGTGAMPTASQTVKVHYEGKLADGTVFDSSIRRGEPTEFKVEQVIQGWQASTGPNASTLC